MNFSTIIAEMPSAEFESFERRFIMMGRNVRNCPFIIIPIGLPASGKSTFINNYKATIDRRVTVVSSDDQIEALAKIQGKTYSEVYPTINMTAIENIMRNEMRAAVDEKKDIIVDRTNLTTKARRRWSSSVPKFYVKIGLVFKIDDEVLFERLNRRGRETGKKIPHRVIQDMKTFFTLPQDGEFDIVRTIEQT